MLLLSTVNFFTRRRSNPGQLHRTGSVRLQCCSPGATTADGVQPLSGCTVYAADENHELRCRVSVPNHAYQILCLAPPNA